MNKRIELPLVEPIYSTYQYQGAGGAIIKNNPSIRNWYLNEAIILTCTTKFLTGFTTPEMEIENSEWWNVPYIEKKWYNTRFINRHVNEIIRNMLNEDYYVDFMGVDDYYIEGKSWYRERHFGHDGLICGYDQDKKTYTIYSYDVNWIYRKFEISQKSFSAGRQAMIKNGDYPNLCLLKPSLDIVKLEPEVILNRLLEYLDPSSNNKPVIEEEIVRGIKVHDYLSIYIDELYDGMIPYDRLDRRIFRLIWEHKKAMCERLYKVENLLQLDNEISSKYNQIVSIADTMRMLYASHHLKRRDSLLPIIKKKLIEVKNEEEKLLREFLYKAKG